MQKVALVGFFGFRYRLEGPYTDRAKRISEELKARGTVQIHDVDSYAWRKSHTHALVGLDREFRENDTVLFVPGIQGLLIFGPVLARFKEKYPKTRVVYYLCGNRIPKLLQDNPQFIPSAQQLDELWVEDPETLEKLQEMGFKNLRPADGLPIEWD